MTLQSMTGFGRAEGEVSGIQWTWEMRSVNGKGLDIRLRLPSGNEKLEIPVRKRIGQKFSRGNIQAVATIDLPKSSVLPSLNPDILDRVLEAIDTVEKKSPRSPSTAAEILAIRGVFDVSDARLEPETLEELQKALLNGLDDCLEALAEHRASEGKALSELLLQHVSKIEELTALAQADPSRTPKAIVERLEGQLGLIKQTDAGLDAQRLHQEAALIATKAEIREELDRLSAHIEAARQLIANGSPAGRKLEFLAQEFNRECNTLCSKSNAVSLTAIGLDLKAVIDQFREQILNVE